MSSTGRLRRYVRAAVLIVPAVAVAAGAMTPAAAASVGPVTAVAVGQAVTPADQFLGVSCPADRFCLGVGWYIPSDGVKRPLAETWDGSAWHITFPLVPSPAPASCAADGVLCEPYGRAWRSATPPPAATTG